MKHKMYRHIFGLTGLNEIIDNTQMHSITTNYTIPCIPGADPDFSKEGFHSGTESSAQPTVVK